MTTLQPDEMVTEVRVPDPGPRTGGTYLKLERKVGDFATAAVAVQVTLDNGNVGQAGIALTGVGPTNLRASAAEDALAAASRRRGDRAPPRGSPPRRRSRNRDNRGTAEYKRNVVRVFIERGLRTAIRPRRPGRRTDMTQLESPKHRPPHGRGHRQRAAAVAPTSSRGCCSSHFLRETLGLTGTHIGCDTTSCGACTVLARRHAGEVVHDARRPGRRPRGHDGRGPRAGRRSCTRSSRRFNEEHGLQCGFCTPGMMLTSVGAARGEPRPDRRGDPLGDLREHLPLHRLPEHRQRRAGRGGKTHEGGVHDARPTHEIRGVGHSVKRKEDARFIRGKGHYFDDITLPGMLHMAILRSPLRPRPDQLDRHLSGRGAARRRRRRHRRAHGAAQPRLDADAVGRHAGGARHRQGALPGPGGRRA